jgi:hypothetical protein
MQKLIYRLQKLAFFAQLEFWNGSFIKRVRVGDVNSKPFFVNKRKLKLEMVAESKCDNNTGFMPTPVEIKLTDWREGRIYTGPEQIAQFLGLKPEEVVEIYADMVKKAEFTTEEIEQTKVDFNAAMKRLREDFLLT